MAVCIGVVAVLSVVSVLALLAVVTVVAVLSVVSVLALLEVVTVVAVMAVIAFCCGCNLDGCPNSNASTDSGISGDSSKSTDRKLYWGQSCHFRLYYLG